MTLLELRTIFYQDLKQKYQNETEALFFIVLEFCTKISKIDYFLFPDKPVLPEQYATFRCIISELKNNVPVQYLLKETSFCGLSFYVDKNVLIPRQETEELVEWILQSVQKEESIRILDIGTGSGCIAVSLAKFLPQSKVFAFDISEKALEVAKKNAKNNNVSIQFLQKDILKTETLDFTYDIIVSNPPYVRESEKVEIAPNVKDYEPHTALFVPDENPLLFYDKIADLAKQYLSKNGKLFFEINQYLADDMLKLLRKKGFQNIELRKDISGNDRMIKIF